MIRYFVSYTVPGGFGRAEIHAETPINSIADIARYEQIISAQNGVPSVMILNFQPFDQPDQPEQPAPGASRQTRPAPNTANVDRPYPARRTQHPA